MSLHDEFQGNQSKLKEGKAKPKQNQRTTKGKPKKSKGKPQWTPKENHEKTGEQNWSISY